MLVDYEDNIFAIQILLHLIKVEIFLKVTHSWYQMSIVIFYVKENTISGLCHYLKKKIFSYHRQAAPSQELLHFLQLQVLGSEDN